MNRILFLVDDDKDDQEIFVDALKNVDNYIHCITALNGLEALQKLKFELISLPDFIFLDLNMPLMGGRECLIEIKKDSNLRHIPVVIYSTSASKKDIQEALQLGAIFLQKPNKFNELVQDLLKIISPDPATNKTLFS
ncbi:MAG TPA: response regulator [Ferruginibacter sp.]|jgi:CheY-like chemotaxis protein|nr:response regulator [Ferruginibacter sp.]